MQIGVGYKFIYEFPQPTPLLLTVHIHYSRASDLVAADHLVTVPSLPVTGYRDSFGNWISRIVAPAGLIHLSSYAVVNDTGRPDPVYLDAVQHAVQALPEETLLFLLGSRYCETDRLSEIAWGLFDGTPLGWGRVQAICDFVHSRIEFGYEHARPTKTAWEVYHERTGVCRDFAHLAVTLCRCMNIPARYCTGYLGDIGVPAMDAPMDFSAWFEAYLGGQWYTFDARFNTPRIGRVLMARGRDAADVALVTTFGPNTLKNFTVSAAEIVH
ncbi:MAG: transglutaminase family protein [Acetobacteraceae bacterium]|jgi:transglutaminase-like putative cysteine protease